MKLKSYFFLFIIIALGFGCFEIEGGNNFNLKSSGNSYGGIDLESGFIAVKPDGNAFLAESSGRLFYGDIERGMNHAIDSVEKPLRVAFSKNRDRIFLVTKTNTSKPSDNCNQFETSQNFKRDSFELIAYSLLRNKIIWSRSVDSSYEFISSLGKFERFPLIFPSDDDEMLIIGNKRSVDFINADTGYLEESKKLDSDLVDIKLMPKKKSLYIVRSEEWDDWSENVSTEILHLSQFGKSISAIKVPNCSSKLALSELNQTAFLAPTHCKKDPVSVIDTRYDRYIKNLPGFGPVTVSKDGSLAVAFIDMQKVDESLFENQRKIPDGWTRFHLMLIDTRNLDFETVKLGDKLPRYTMTPDGKIVLIDFSSGRGNIRVLDHNRRTIRDILGYRVKLSNFVMSADSKFVYLIDDLKNEKNSLYRLSIDDEWVEEIDLDFSPYSINIIDRSQKLILGNHDNSRITIFEPQYETVYQEFYAPRRNLSNSCWY